MAFRDRKIVAYHKNWIYFTELFGLRVVDFVEPKPGIPPSARHVHDLVEEVKKEQVGVLFAASYFGEAKIGQIAERLGTATVAVPLGPGGDGPADYFSLISLWVDLLAEACSR